METQPVHNPTNFFRRHPVFAFHCAFFIYTSGVHGACVFLPLLGPDFALFGDPHAIRGFLRWIFAIQHFFLGDAIWGYRLLNLMLLYAVMSVIFFLTYAVNQRTWWLGSLAAVLFMAHPMNVEAVYTLRGAVGLMLVLCALGGNLAFTRFAASGRSAWSIVALVFLTFAGFAATEARVALLFPFFFAMFQRKGLRWRLLYLSIPFLIVYGVLQVFSLIWGQESLPSLAGLSYLPFLFYPLGLLPQTAQWFWANPWLFQIVIGCAVFVIILLVWAARDPTVILQGVLCILGSLHISASFDAVHFRGGGSALLILAYACMGFALLCGRIQQHSKWNRPVVTGTTLVCVGLFVLRWNMLGDWFAASQMVSEFRAAVVARLERSEPKPWVLLPNFAYYRSAPVMLAEVIRWDRSLPTSPAFFTGLTAHVPSVRDWELVVRKEGGYFIFEVKAKEPFIWEWETFSNSYTGAVSAEDGTWCSLESQRMLGMRGDIVSSLLHYPVPYTQVFFEIECPKIQNAEMISLRSVRFDTDTAASGATSVKKSQR